MSISRQLYQLQEVDVELEANEQALARVNAQIGESQVVIATRANLTQKQQHLEELKKQQQSVEWEIDDYSSKIAEIEEKLYSGRIQNPKELSSLQREAEGLKRQRSGVEDTELEIMEQISGVEARLKTLGDELQRLETEWCQQQQQLSTEAEQHKAVIADLRQKWQQQVDEIDPAAFSAYREIKKQRGRAVARLERGTCRACGITLSTAQLQRAKANQMLRCSNCGRILFLP